MKALPRRGRVGAAAGASAGSGKTTCPSSREPATGLEQLAVAAAAAVSREQVDEDGRHQAEDGGDGKRGEDQRGRPPRGRRRRPRRWSAARCTPCHSAAAPGVRAVGELNQQADEARDDVASDGEGGHRALPRAGRRRLATSAAAHEDAVHARLRRHVRQRDWDRDRVQLSERVDQASGVERLKGGLDDEPGRPAIFRREGGEQVRQPSDDWSRQARQPRRHVECGMSGRSRRCVLMIRALSHRAASPSAAKTQPWQVVVQHDLERSRAAPTGVLVQRLSSERRRRGGGEQGLRLGNLGSPQLATAPSADRVHDGGARSCVSRQARTSRCHTLPNPVRNGVAASTP